MVDVKSFVRSSPPHLPYQEIADEILGKDFDLSLVFIGKHRSEKLNTKWRDKNRPANVLSFPFDKKSGEIFITPSTFPKNETLHMFIHALLHLKGFDHGSIMENEEQILLDKWQDILSQD